MSSAVPVPSLSGPTLGVSQSSSPYEHDALVGGIDARSSRTCLGGHVLHPTTARDWVRPHELADARALIDKLDISSDAKQQCPACHEENPGISSSVGTVIVTSTGCCLEGCRFRRSLSAGLE